MRIRKAVKQDIEAVAGIYDRIHTAEEKGQVTIGWERGVYPERETALVSLERDDLFVMLEGEELESSPAHLTAWKASTWC